MSVPKYDLFMGRTREDGLWLEVSGDLRVAIERMNECAAKEPGPYFVFSNRTGEIAARVDTSEKKKGQSAG